MLFDTSQLDQTTNKNKETPEGNAVMDFSNNSVATDYGD